MVPAYGLNETFDRLSGLVDVSSRLMFGGLGLYWRGVIFATAHQRRLYFKVDDQSRRLRGPWDGAVLPELAVDLEVVLRGAPEVLDDPDVLRSWAVAVIRAGRRARVHRFGTYARIAPAADGTLQAG